MEKISSVVEKIGKRNIQIGAAVVIVAVIVVVFFVGKPAVAPEGEIADVEKVATTTEATTTPVVKKVAQTPPASAQVSLSYQKALELYPADKRIQLSGTTACQATPTNVTYKNGTSIMIDNRSAQAHTVKVGATYVIPGYGFKIVKLSSNTLPYAFVMDCDRQQNIATLSVQR